MKTFLLASSNHHKALEFQGLFSPSIIKVEAAPLKIEIEETGQTFWENAYLKAKGYYESCKSPVLADDSGLCVEALPEELGILSARYGGPGLSDRERAEKLLKAMENITNRRAWFQCVLCFYPSPDEVFYFEGRLNGAIGFEVRGEQGFGYDPVFIPDDCEGTLGQNSEWKSKHSHRAKACRMAEAFFRESTRHSTGNCI